MVSVKRPLQQHLRQQRLGVDVGALAEQDEAEEGERMGKRAHASCVQSLRAKRRIHVADWIASSSPRNDGTPKNRARGPGGREAARALQEEVGRLLHHPASARKRPTPVEQRAASGSSISRIEPAIILSSASVAVFGSLTVLGSSATRQRHALPRPEPGVAGVGAAFRRRRSAVAGARRTPSQNPSRPAG